MSPSAWVINGFHGSPWLWFMWRWSGNCVGSGHVLHPGVFTGEQSFELSPLGEGRTRFVQREAFRGLLVPFLPNGLAAITRRGFEAMNVALKEQAEAES